MAEATSVVANLMDECARRGACEPWTKAKRNAVASRLVAAAWAKDPSLFDGRYGRRPHRVSVAASAFAGALCRWEIETTLGEICFLCLGLLLAEIERNGPKYPLTDLDKVLLEGASETFMRVVQKADATPLGQEISQLIPGG